MKRLMVLGVLAGLLAGCGLGSGARLDSELANTLMTRCKAGDDVACGQLVQLERPPAVVDTGSGRDFAAEHRAQLQEMGREQREQQQRELDRTLPQSVRIVP